MIYMAMGYQQHVDLAKRFEVSLEDSRCLRSIRDPWIDHNGLTPWRLNPKTRLTEPKQFGLLLCAWAKKLGMQVIGTVSSDEKARVAREFGCEHVIVTKTYTFASHVKKIFGDGADVIVDGLGESAFRENFESLAPCGHWISLGQATGLFQSISTELLLSKSATFSRPVAFAYVATQSQMSVRAQRVWTALNDGTINAPPIERHSLESAARAHERLESLNTVGSLILIA